MPKFGRRSTANLETCHWVIRKIMESVVHNYDCSVFEGARSQELQDQHFHSGLSKKKWPDSLHNTTPERPKALAWHCLPYPIDWKDLDGMRHFAGWVQATAAAMGYVVRWGGDWDSDRDLHDQTFYDLAHFELILPKQEGGNHG